MQVIDSFRGENRWLSNFHECEIIYEGISYPTTEHAYQAAKSLDKNVRRAIAALPKARHAMHIGRALRVRGDWEQIKFAVMKEVNLYKFYNHPQLKEKLLATGNDELIEGNNWGDKIWGMCDGEGENNLGKILMEIRHEIQNTI